MFLTAETELASHHQWVTMLPPSATVLETTTRFSMQLLGRESSVVDPVSAAQPTNKGGDFMRAIKEQAQVGQRACAVQMVTLAVLQQVPGLCAGNLLLLSQWR